MMFRDPMLRRPRPTFNQALLPPPSNYMATIQNKIGNKMPVTGAAPPVVPPPTPAVPTPAPAAPTGPVIDNTSEWTQQNSQYGADSGQFRRLLGLNGQSNYDMWHDDPSATGASGGSDGGGSDDRSTSKMQALIDQGYAHYVQDSGGDSPTGHYELDQSKLPKTKFGDMGISPYDPRMDDSMINKQAKYYDPNYGWITPTKNLNLNTGLSDMFYNIAPAMFTMGLGAMAAPVAGLGMAGNIASKVPQLASSFGRGGGIGSLVGAAAGAAGGMSELPSMIRSVGPGG